MNNDWDKCNHCGYSILRRKTARLEYCDHLDYPENCKVCRVRESKIRKASVQARQQTRGKDGRFSSKMALNSFLVEGYHLIHSIEKLQNEYDSWKVIFEDPESTMVLAPSK